MGFKNLDDFPTDLFSLLTYTVLRHKTGKITAKKKIFLVIKNCNLLILLQRHPSYFSLQP
jgi:hypothetical protein